MKRIILHWTAGKYNPNACDREHYHFLVDGSGEIHIGDFPPEANEICRADNYAKHTGGGNTGSVGVAMCAMFGFKNEKETGKYPITPVQLERTMKLCAQILKKYGLPVTKKTMMTHYEFGLEHKNTSSFGKIDIIFLPPYSFVPREDVGSFIRSKVRWYMEKV